MNNINEGEILVDNINITKIPVKYFKMRRTPLIRFDIKNKKAKNLVLDILEFPWIPDCRISAKDALLRYYDTTNNNYELKGDLTIVDESSKKEELLKICIDISKKYLTEDLV